MSLASVFSTFNSFRSSQSAQYESMARNGETPAQKDGQKGGQDEVDIGGAKADPVTYPGKAGSAEGPLALLPGASSRTGAANTILSFIAGRLHIDATEGATPEELMTRLESGLKGFIQGYQEAYNQLAGMGFLYPDVEEAIEKTFTDVLNGIDEIAEGLGIESPVTDELRESQAERRAQFVPSEPPAAAPIGSQAGSQASVGAVATYAQTTSLESNVQASNLKELIDASSFNYREQTSRSFSFVLKTQDGDEVTIKAAYASHTMLEGESVRYGNGEDNSVNGSFRASAGFYLDVQGELDEEEMAAIEDLLTQVREVSDMFFSGDIEKAFEKATEMGFNSEEIAEFSLRLRYQQSTRYEERYQEYIPNASPSVDSADKLNALNSPDDNLMLLARFVQALEDMRMKAAEVGIANDGFASLLADKTDSRDVSESKGGSDNEPAKPVSLMRDLLERLDAIANPE